MSNSTENVLRVLLVEDDQESGASMELMLNRRGVCVTLLSSGEEAVKQFSMKDFDAVVSDIRLLGMSGVEVLRRIRTLDRFFPVILLTGYDSIESAIAALQEGAQDYILKPLDNIDQLLKPLQNAVTNYRLHCRRVELERELEISEKRFRKIYDNAAVGVALLDRSGRFLQANQMAGRLFKFPDNELVGHRLDELIRSPDDLQKIRDVFERLADTLPTASPMEINTSRGTDPLSFWCLWHFSFFETGEHNQARILAFLSDIDEKKQLETNLNKHRESLFQAEKLAAIGKLAGGIAHDFNNITYIINGNLRLALNHLQPGTLEHEKIMNALAACESAVDLTERIRMTSQAGIAERKPLNVNGLIHQVLNILSFRLPANVSLHTILNDPDDLVMGDHLELQQVLMNLLINAIQAMPGGGVLSITQHREFVDETLAKKLTLSASGHFVCLDIGDTGVGIPDENLPRIFEPFFSTKHNEGCSGLGLPMVYGIIKSHGGCVNVSSKVDEGTKFSIHLPLAEAQIEDIPDAARLPGGTESILIVDDDLNVLRITEEVLQQFGYRTTAFSDCHQCLEHFKTNHENYDLAIIDFVMPQMTGGQLSRELMNIRPNIPVIILTAFSYTAASKNHGKTGIYKYVNKSISPEDLAQTIRTVLDRDDPPPATTSGKTILVVDDNDQTRNVLREILEDASYRVIEAQNGRIGIELFSSHHIDLVLTDLFMPEKDGLEVIMECKKNQPGIKVFAFTGGPGRVGWDCLALAAPLGADYTFRGIIDHQLLLDKIAEHLNPPAP